MTNNEAIEIITHFDKHIIPCDEYGYRIDSDLMEAHLMAAKALRNGWIPVSERLPEERDSIFKRFYGTKLWQDGMFCTVSDTVLAAIEDNDGKRHVKAMHTQSGEWNLDSMPWAKCVTHWMPLPEPPKEEMNNG